MSNDPADIPDESDDAENNRPEGTPPNQQPLNGEAGTNGPLLTPDPSWPKPVPTPPEMMEWMRQNITEEEIIAGLREIEETGGLQLSDFIDELERMAGSNE